MDGRGGGCCVARHAGGAYDMSQVDRIMLRFRPIAPKPDFSNGSSSSGASVAQGSGQTLVKGSDRKKRRYSRVANAGSRVSKRCGGRKRKVAAEVADVGAEMVVKTLPLMPETPDVRDVRCVGLKERFSFPLCLSFGNRGREGGRVFPCVGHAAEGPAPGVKSWVKVQCVTDKWIVGCLPGTEEEKVKNYLDTDACPGFISDCFNNVRWMNAAYRKTVTGEAKQVAVSVVLENGVILPVECAAFTCRVRLVTSGKEKNSPTLPCDVWRMDSGGFAWRLDTKAALSLGR